MNRHRVWRTIKSVFIYMFIGVSSALDLRGVDGGFESSQTNGGAIAGLDLSLRVGLGLEGALSDGADGLVFVQAGIHADTNSTNQFYGPSDGSNTGDLTSAIPSEWGRSLRVRMPYYLIPGDLLLLSPMYFFNREAYTRIAVTAVNGGLLHWQQAVSARPGRFQFVLGREFRVAVYGVGHHAELLLPGHSPDAPLLLERYESTGYEVPIVEYRPYRDYSFDQSSSFIVQLFARADVVDDCRSRVPLARRRRISARSIRSA